MGMCSFRDTEIEPPEPPIKIKRPLKKQFTKLVLSGGRKTGKQTLLKKLNSNYVYTNTGVLYLLL
jgi:predicted AAA+ superfamily ATPase